MAMFDIKTSAWAAVVAVTLLPAQASAASDAELDQIRAQIRSLRQDYDARIKALEERLKAAETEAAQAKAQAAQAPVAPVAQAPVPPPTPTSTTQGLAAFNPAVSAILNGQYANLSRDPSQWRMAGFLQGGEVGPGRRGFSLGESELAFSANVDPQFSGTLIFSVTPEDTISVEEGYGIFKGAPGGIVPKFGRFFSALGYLNEQHAHVWDFIDAPLAYQAFLGGQYRQDGVQASWVAPTEQFIQLGAEAGNGDFFPGTPRNKNGAGSGVLFARTGGDVGDSHSWQAGIGYLRTGAESRTDVVPDMFGNDATLAFSGRSRVWNASFVWKWAPHGDPHYRNFKIQGEYLWRHEEGDLAFAPLVAPDSASTSGYSSRQSGGYVQAIYQFMPLWRLGLRYDRLSPGSIDFGANGAFLATPSFHPERSTAMVDWSPSEFSRVRLQFGQAKPSPGFTDNELFVQYILSIGAHGAHIF
jgi:outer membrane murein-binding lipoprotein Lpp